MERTVVVAALLLALAGASTAGPSGATTADGPSLFQPEGFDETSFEITVFENRSARWTFEHRRNLNETEVNRFRDFEEEFERNSTDLYRSFVNRSTALVAVGTDATGRNMTALGHARSASVQRLGQRQGVVTLSFTWTNFAVRNDGPASSGDRVVIGDVFEGGIPIGENQRLVVQHGTNLTFADASPDDYSISGENLNASESITWFGERRFADSRPRVEFRQPGATDGGPAEGSNTVMFVGLLLIVAVLGAGVAYQRGLLDRLPVGDDDGTAAGTTDDAGGAAGAAASTPEPEVVSDRDRVKELLSENGGRMKQVRIVDETEWSKSKVSMLLSEMEEEGEISKLRVGRENIVSLSGHEPDAAGSPFDDE